jgi:hypothetical protein
MKQINKTFIKNLIESSSKFGSIDSLNYSLAQLNISLVKPLEFVDYKLICNSYSFFEETSSKVELIKTIVPLKFYKYIPDFNTEFSIGYSSINNLIHYDYYEEDCVVYDIDLDIKNFEVISQKNWEKQPSEWEDPELYYLQIQFFVKFSVVDPDLIQLTCFDNATRKYQRVFIPKTLFHLKLALLNLGHPRFCITLYEDFIQKIFS